MHFVVFARFKDKISADAALTQVRAEIGAPDRFRIFTHEHVADPGHFAESVQHADNIVETDARHGRFVGLVTGLVLGPAFGAGLAAVVGGPETWILGGALGLVMGPFAGVIMSGLAGVGMTDARLRKLTQGLQEGEVVVTIETRKAGAEHRVEDILRRNGADVARKRAV